MTAAEPAEALAPAKLNLTLHLRGRRADGYHLLESLVVFPRLGDRLTLEDGPGLSLSVEGPFADMLPSDGENLVLRAAEALARAHGVAAPAALRLEKRLPVASGIGGGSTDAAAALRLLSRAWGVAVPDGLALSLGADVPVCMAARACMMSGIGERIAPAPALPEAWVVLANPMVSVSTGAVFSALARRECPPGPPPPAAFRDFDELVAWLAEGRNDLEAAAVGLCPVIGEVLEALGDAPLARMSGSGATCFALWPDREAALAASERLRATRPGWWTAAAPVPASRPAPMAAQG